jgi:hypothetical protein
LGIRVQSVNVINIGLLRRLESFEALVT